MCTAVRLKWTPLWADGACVRATRPREWAARAGHWSTAMAERRIPRPDGDFDAYANHYYLAAKDFYTGHGLDEKDLNALADALAAWNTSYPAHASAQAAAESARQAKAAARRELEAQIRPVTAFVQSYPATTDADRATIGITVRDPHGTPVTPPTSRPLVRVESGQRLQHRLRFVDESTPTRTRKPRGAAGAEVWLALVEVNQPPPPLGDSYRFVQMSSRGEALAEFSTHEAGKTACYALRWVTPTGARGPWSEVATATVAA